MLKLHNAKFHQRLISQIKVIGWSQGQNATDETPQDKTPLTIMAIHIMSQAITHWQNCQCTICHHPKCLGVFSIHSSIQFAIGCKNISVIFPCLMNNFFVRFYIRFQFLSIPRSCHLTSTFCSFIVYLSAHMGMVVALFLTSVVACEDQNLTHGFNFPLGYEFKSICVLHFHIHVSVLESPIRRCTANVCGRLIFVSN